MSIRSFYWNRNPSISGSRPGSRWFSPSTTSEQEIGISENQECSVCLSEAFIPSDPPTSTCSHDPRACEGCLRRVISSSLETGSFATGIPCPTEGCSQRMMYSDIRKWADTTLFERFAKLSVNIRFR